MKTVRNVVREYAGNLGDEDEDHERKSEQEYLLNACLTPLMSAFVLKATIVVFVRMVQTDSVSGHDVNERTVPIVGGPMRDVFDVDEWWESCICRYKTNQEKYMAVDGSNWLLKGLVHVMVKVSLVPCSKWSENSEMSDDNEMGGALINDMSEDDMSDDDMSEDDIQMSDNEPMWGEDDECDNFD